MSGSYKLSLNYQTLLLKLKAVCITPLLYIFCPFSLFVPPLTLFHLSLPPPPSLPPLSFTGDEWYCSAIMNLTQGKPHRENSALHTRKGTTATNTVRISKWFGQSPLPGQHSNT